MHSVQKRNLNDIFTIVAILYMAVEIRYIIIVRAVTVRGKMIITSQDDAIQFHTSKTIMAKRQYVKK